MTSPELSNTQGALTGFPYVWISRAREAKKVPASRLSPSRNEVTITAGMPISAQITWANMQESGKVLIRK